MEKGLSGMIGKGNRSQAVKDAMQRYGTVYFAATGGAGALLSRCKVFVLKALQTELNAMLMLLLTQPIFELFM